MWFLAVLLFVVVPGHLQDPSKLVTLTGRAVNSEDGSGVPRGTISIFGRFDGVYNLRIKEGRFSGELPAADGYRLQIWAPGFAEYQLNNVSVYPGMEPLLLKLLPTRAVTGRVADPEGKGIPKVSVGLALDPDGRKVPMGVITNEEGFFRMDFASEPKVFYLVTEKGGYEPVPPVPFEYPAHGDIVIVLTPLSYQEIGSIVGVATMGGTPLEGFEVDLTRSGIMAYQRCQIDSSGEFHFLDLNPGEYKLGLRRNDRNHTKLEGRTVNVTPGEPIRVVFDLPQGETVSGVVVNLAGEPLLNSSVSLDAGTTESEPLADTPAEWEAMRRRGLRKLVSYHSTTDKDGRFDLLGVEPGPYRLRVASRSYLVLTMSVEVPTDALRIVLEPGLSLRGVLVDQDGQVVTSFHYSMDALMPSDGGGGSGPVASAQGLFLIQGLRPTLYSFEVYLDDGRAAKCTIDLSLGENILFQMPGKEGDELAVRYEKP